jgi:hypothetical protein
MIWKRAKRLYARIHEVRHFPPYLHVIVSGGYNPLLAINREARDYVLETCMLMFNPRYFNARQSSCLFDYSIDTLYFNVNIFQGSLQRMRGSFKCLKTSSDHTWRRRRRRYVRFSEQYHLFLIVKRGLELLLLIYEIDFLFIRAYPITFETFPLGTLLKFESRILTPRFWYRSNIWLALRNFSMR